MLGLLVRRHLDGGGKLPEAPSGALWLAVLEKMRLTG